MKMGVAIMVMAMLISAPIMVSSTHTAWAPAPQTTTCNYFNSPCYEGASFFDASAKKICCDFIDNIDKSDEYCFCRIISASRIARSNCSLPDNAFRQCDDFYNSLYSKKTETINPAIVVCVAVGVLGVLFIGIYCTRRKILNCNPKPPVRPNPRFKPSAAIKSQDGLPPAGTSRQDGANKAGFVTPESLQYKLVDLETATNNFSKKNQIGRGGFGIVYKGTLSNGQQIAVKRLSNGSGQGDREFQTEIVLLAKLQHKNLVRLLGFCVVEDEALLVYELVTNKSLDYFLFDKEKRAELNWQCRFEIIKGVARGMLYLHEDSPTKTMHRDLKAANVLLDGEMCPKIADFGLARICDIGQTHINPTRIVGTHGYMAPEYLLHGKFSPKSDVYALGVLILEIVSGTRVGGSSFDQPQSEGLLSYAWRCWEDEKPFEILDPMLRNSSTPSDEVLICVQMGLLCVQENSNLRPTMSTIVHMFNSQSAGVTLSMPQHPAFIYSGTSHETTTTSSAGDTVTLPQWSGRNSARRFR